MLEEEWKADEERWRRQMERLEALEALLPLPPKKGRRPDKYREVRREVIRRVAAMGVKGEQYCKALDAKQLPTPFSWQKNEGCPETYLAAYWHPDPAARAKWRQRIANEKSKATHH